MNAKSYTVKQLAQAVGGEIAGDENIVITAVNSIELARKGHLTFAGSSEYIAKLADCKADAVLVSGRLEAAITQIIVKNVDEALIDILGMFAPQHKPQPGIHPSAFVSPTAVIGGGVSIGAFVFIDDNVKIGDNTVIDAGTVIKRDSVIGSSCRIDGNVTIYHGCRIGNQCVIQAGTAVGSVGFGYRKVNNMPQLIPHWGGVVIEDFVEIGANCCIDRAKFGDTVIGMGTKMDNLVQIAHNCRIGKCCLFAAGVGIAGSAVIGNGVIIGGHSGVVEHVTVGDGTMIASKTVVTSSLKPGSAVYGMPARDIKKMMRVQAETNRLPETVKRIKDLEKKVANLEKADNN